jgi:hypothetical protein
MISQEPDLNHGLQGRNGRVSCKDLVVYQAICVSTCSWNPDILASFRPMSPTASDPAMETYVTKMDGLIVYIT